MAYDDPITLDAGAYHLRCLELRPRAERAARDILKALTQPLPNHLTLKAGDESFEFFTSDLVRDTGERFIHTLKADGVIEVDPAHVPSAGKVVDLLHLRAPPAMTVQELVDVIQTLSYLSAWTALDALQSYVPSSLALADEQVIVLLAAAIKHTQDAPLVKHLATKMNGMRPSDSDMQLFWDSMSPVTTPAQCVELLHAASPDAVSQWMWSSLAALMCDGQCTSESGPPELPADASLFCGRMMELSMTRCKTWCACQRTAAMCLAANLNRVPAAVLHADKLQPILLKAADRAAFAVKVPTNYNTIVYSQGQKLRLGGMEYNFFTSSGTTLDHKDEFALYLHVRPAPPRLTITFAAYDVARAQPLFEGFESLELSTSAVSHYAFVHTFTAAEVGIGCAQLVKLSDLSNASTVLACVEVQLSDDE